MRSTLAQKLATILCEQISAVGRPFCDARFRGGFKHTFPFLRWPQAQLFYSLTNLLQASQKGAQQ